MSEGKEREAFRPHPALKVNHALAFASALKQTATDHTHSRSLFYASYNIKTSFRRRIQYESEDRAREVSSAQKTGESTRRLFVVKSQRVEKRRNKK